MKRVRVADVVVDAGTQVRAALDEQVVKDYAEAMTAGAVFPPIVLFHDGNQHYLADGFHRLMAAQRIAWRELDADVRAGTKEDALWFALGANKTNGKRLTDSDKRHAIEIAVAAWPERSAGDIAAQVGCGSSYVSKVRGAMLPQSPQVEVPQVVGRDGKRYPAVRRTEAEQARRQQVSEMVRAGRSNDDINQAIGKIRHDLIADVRRELGMARADQSRGAVAERRQRMREMAASGHTSIQIASAVGLSDRGCREALRAEGIQVLADRVTSGTRRHDANRIVERIVMDAENLTEGVNLIAFADLDRSRLADWLGSLAQSRDKLGAFIRRLMKEQQHGQVA